MYNGNKDTFWEVVMLRIKKNSSATLSLILAYIALAVVAAVAVAIPFLNKFLYDHFFIGNLNDGGVIAFVILFYLALLPVAVADVLLIRLLCQDFREFPEPMEREAIR